MRRNLLLLLVAALIGAACARSDQSVGTSSDGGADVPTGELMAAGLRQLVTVDHTFGDGPPPFNRYLVLDTTDPQAGAGSGDGRARPLTAAERDAIDAALDPLGLVEFINEPDDWRTPELV
ncbi:MAG: hypothetical protein OER95_14780, partial [Acidimicrobiia bacterium]|nr:hypothetical protein [Acidimicrobiia bacterium]